MAYIPYCVLYMQFSIIYRFICNVAGARGRTRRACCSLAATAVHGSPSHLVDAGPLPPSARVAEYGSYIEHPPSPTPV